jgi:hypothetical protein
MQLSHHKASSVIKCYQVRSSTNTLPYHTLLILDGTYSFGANITWLYLAGEQLADNSLELPERIGSTNELSKGE